MYESKGLAITDLEIGVSTEGLEGYLAKLEADLLTSVATKIDDITNVTTALDAGWQGVARDRFDAQFTAMREKVKTDLQAEYANLVARLQELATDYVTQDQNMIAAEE